MAKHYILENQHPPCKISTVWACVCKCVCLSFTVVYYCNFLLLHKQICLLVQYINMIYVDSCELVDWAKTFSWAICVRACVCFQATKWLLWAQLQVPSNRITVSLATVALHSLCGWLAALTTETGWHLTSRAEWERSEKQKRGGGSGRGRGDRWETKW